MSTTAVRPRAASGTGGSTTRGGSAYAGLGLMTRLALRANRWFYLVWILVLVATVSGTAKAYRTTITDDAAGRAVAEGLSHNSTMKALLGPAYDLLHVGSFTMFRVGTFVAAMAAIMAVLGVIRSSRADEEDGRTELLRSAEVGRHAPLAASLLVAFLASALFGVLISATLYAAQAEPAGALVLGAGLGLTAAMFAGVGAVAAQLRASARSARFLALGVLAASYLIRVVADGMPEDRGLSWLGWLSPSEWAAYARPYAGERPWVLLLPLAVTAALAVLAVRLEASRDYGAGLRPEPLGPARGRLGSAGALGLRLQRPSIIGWAVGIAIFAVVCGFLNTQFTQLINDESDPDLADRFRRMGGGAQSIADAFVVAMTGIIVGLVAVAVLQLFGTLRREEDRGHAEALLATATSRPSYVLSHVVPALLGTTGILVVFAVIFAVPAALQRHDAGLIGQYVGAALVQAPGVWAILGLAVLIHGVAPRLAVIPWLLVGWTLFANWIAPVVNVPDSVLHSTPFSPLPKLPADPMNWTPVLAETLVAVALIALGIAAYRRRDLSPRA